MDLAGDIHFDADEPWTVGSNSPDSKDLLMIAMHEVRRPSGPQVAVDDQDLTCPCGTR